MPRFFVDPRYQADLMQQGLRGAEDYLVCTEGVTVGRHASRHVRRLSLGEFQIFLKREHPVQWRDRLRSWLDGFGWVSKAHREWRILRELQQRGLPAPEPLAMGEIGNMAFLAVRGFSNSTDLPTFLAHGPSNNERHILWRNLGRAFARLHQEGFTHPDLYAKHVFVNRSTLQVAFVDFQRTRRQKSISRKQRCRDLARLDASLHPGAVNLLERLGVLHAYLHECFGQYQRNSVRAFAAAISAESRRLLKRRRVRNMYVETAQLAGESSVVTYCRVRVPVLPENRMTSQPTQPAQGRDA